MSEGRDFGLALRLERERRGIPLEAVAERTKIGLALLSGLERGDLARWPAGIFRRAFFRAYVETVGLSSDEMLPRFERAFPEPADESTARAARATPAAYPPDPLRLSLARRPGDRVLAIARRLAALAIDLAAIAGAGFTAGAAGAQSPAIGLLAASVVYFGAGTLLLETSPGTWLLRRALRPRRLAAPRPTTFETRDAPPLSEDGERRPDVAAAPRVPPRERRHVRVERRRTPRPGQHPQ